MAIGIIFIKEILADFSYKEIEGYLIGSVIFGLFMAISYRMKAKGLDLPLWKDYLKNESEGETKGTVRKKGRK